MLTGISVKSTASSNHYEASRQCFEVAACLDRDPMGSSQWYQSLNAHSNPVHPMDLHG